MAAADRPDPGASGAELLGLLAGSSAKRAGPDPVQPDLPLPGRRRQRQLDLLRPARRSRGRSRKPSSTRPTARPRRPPSTSRPRSLLSRSNNELFALLQKYNVTITAHSAQRGSIVPDKPDLRLRTDAAVPAAARVDLPASRRGRWRRRRADVVRALARAPSRGRRPARHVQRRRRDRRGQGRADRDRRLPQEPRQVHPPRRPDPAWCPAQRTAGHGQDAARPGGRRRGRRSVLPDVRVGVRRDDRRSRRLARPRPVRAGQGGGTGDHLHRRARRDRPLALGWRGRTSPAATTNASRRSIRSSPRWTASTRASA